MFVRLTKSGEGRAFSLSRAEQENSTQPLVCDVACNFTGSLKKYIAGHAVDLYRYINIPSL